MATQVSGATRAPVDARIAVHALQMCSLSWSTSPNVDSSVSSAPHLHLTIASPHHRQRLLDDLRVLLARGAFDEEALEEREDARDERPAQERVHQALAGIAKIEVVRTKTTKEKAESKRYAGVLQLAAAEEHELPPLFLRQLHHVVVQKIILVHCVSLIANGCGFCPLLAQLPVVSAPFGFL